MTEALASFTIVRRKQGETMTTKSTDVIMGLGMTILTMQRLRRKLWMWDSLEMQVQE